MSFILRFTAQKAPMSFTRSLSVTAAKKDLVQDLYINQLKSYKPAPKAADIHVGSVRNFSAPKPPTVPSLPTDLASELSKFDAEEPTLGSTTPKAAADVEDAGGAQEYLEFLEKDIPKTEAQH
ncbi:hypothetical protein L204_101843 [Cryptococcus depauperatus]|nr:F-type H+-transporting ATPase subunit H [Cryptococcus depauperatus CBS 7855]